MPLKKSFLACEESSLQHGSIYLDERNLVSYCMCNVKITRKLSREELPNP